MLNDFAINRIATRLNAQGYVSESYGDEGGDAKGVLRSRLEGIIQYMQTSILEQDVLSTSETKEEEMTENTNYAIKLLSELLPMIENM